MIESGNIKRGESWSFLFGNYFALRIKLWVLTLKAPMPKKK